jgi:hypothetical protein
VFALLLTLLATAAPGDVTLSLSGEAVIDDPFVERRGLTLGAGYTVRPWIYARASIGLFPNLGDADHTAFTRILIEEEEVGPLVSRTTVRNELTVRLAPIRHETSTLSTSIGALLGAGVSRSADAVLGDAIATEDLVDPVQWVPTWHLGIDADVQWRVWGARFHLTHVARRERLNGVSNGVGELWIGASLLWRWPGPSRKTADNLR